MKYSLFTVILPELSPDRIVQELKKAGFDGVEWRIHKDYHFDPDTIEKNAGHIKEMTEDAGLGISNLGSYVPVTDRDSARRLIHAASVMKAPSVRLAPPRYNEKDGYQTLRAKARRSLEGLIPLLKDSGVKALIEIHHATITSSASSALLLLNGLPPEQAGIILDPGNMIIEGKEEWQMGLEILGPYLSYVHAKNTKWRREEGLWKSEWTCLEDGMVDWREVLTALRNVRYDGFLSIETLFRVPLGTKGLLNEDLKRSRGTRPWADRVHNDIAYLRSIEDELAREG